MKPYKPSEHVIKGLKKIEGGCLPGSELNAGVGMVLIREGWAISLQIPSPYKYGRSRMVGALEITDAGREYLKGLK